MENTNKSDFTILIDHKLELKFLSGFCADFNLQIFHTKRSQYYYQLAYKSK